MAGLTLTLALTISVCVAQCRGALTSKELCKGTPHCYHNQSLLCEDNSKPLSCNHMLKEDDTDDASCAVSRIDPKECYIEKSYLAPPDDLPFILRMYYYNTWMQERAALNLTFVEPDWQTVKFRYQGRDHPEMILCREISLRNVSLPLTDTLLWDCPFFTEPDYSNHTFDLSVSTDKGTGGNYAFSIPDEKRFDPNKTKIEDWHVFFFLHLDHIYRSPHLPVTVQSAHFKNLAYNISLVKCLDTDPKCHLRSKLVSHVVNRTEMDDSIDGFPALWTELLPSWSAPAYYAVTVQIISPECGTNGCFISVSPTFEIKESQLGIWIFVSFLFILVFTFAFTITLHQRSKGNKKRLQSLRENPQSVLLIYLPENSACLELVKTFAGFLKDACYVHPYVVDIDVGTKNPNSWTSEHMNKADKILFIVPGNLNGESVTPIRDQWNFAVQYLTGHYFVTHHITYKVATVLLPFSADIPFQIASVRRFYLMKELASIVTWIHNDSWVDCKLFWGPQIKASQKASAYSLGDVLNAARKASQCTRCHKTTMIPRVTESKNTDIVIPVEDNHKNVHPLCQGNHISESSICKEAIRGSENEESEFDPNIPSVQALLEPEMKNNDRKIAIRSLSESEDSDDDDLDDDILLGR